MLKKNNQCLKEGSNINKMCQRIADYKMIKPWGIKEAAFHPEGQIASVEPWYKDPTSLGVS